MDGNYILDLPNEILIRILGYLNTCDIFEYCEAYPEHIYFLSERHVIGTLNFHKTYKANNFLKIAKKLDASCVTVLNINGIYWHAPNELRTCIQKFHNLECLYILDTGLRVSEIDCRFLSTLKKLKKLAICAYEKDLSTYFLKEFPLVHSLMIHFTGASSSNIRMFTNLQSLQELWVIAKKEPIFIDLLPVYDSRSPLRRYVLQSHAPLPVSYRSSRNMEIVYENRKTGYLYFEKLHNKVEVDPTIYDEHFKTFWEIWTSLHCSSPYGVGDAKKLLLNDRNFCFEELNFCVKPLLCCGRYLEGIRQCLNSSTTRKLKKLSFRICFLEVDHDRNNRCSMKTSEDYEDIGEREAKRQKLSKGHPLNDLVKWFPYLKELEIWEGCSYSAAISLQFNYDSISSLVHLEKLTLSVFRTTPINFICDIFRNCKNLTSFRVANNNNEPFMKAMCTALKFAHNLRDLRCESSYINIIRILEGLNANHSSKLERVVLKGKTTEQLDKKPLNLFLNNNKQLVFFCIMLQEVPERILKVITSDMMKIKTSQQQVFIALKKDDHPKIPEIHRYEMVTLNTTIAVCDIYNDFLM